MLPADTPVPLALLIVSCAVTLIVALRYVLTSGLFAFATAVGVTQALAWTGVKNTGRGGSLSVIGFQNLTRPKSYHLKKA